MPWHAEAITGRRAHAVHVDSLEERSAHAVAR